MASNRPNRPIVLAAGGTGGHLFPAQALADELRRRRHRVLLMTDERGLKWREHFPETELHRTLSGTTNRSGWLSRAVGLFKLAFGTVHAFAMLSSRRPGAVIGFGGYPSLPTMLAAIVRGDNTCLHEQNGVMGRANRLIAPRVRRIALAFPNPLGLAPDLLQNARVTGNPVRQSVIDMRAAPYPPLAADAPIELLVFGGSQGATVLSEVVPAAIERLPADLRGRLRVTQQCREADMQATKARYVAMRVLAEVKPFFTDLPQRMAHAHLVVSRSGASTVCELSVIGRPAILVPLPGAIDGDQSANATRLVGAGGAWLMPQHEFTAETLAAKLAELLSQPDALRAAAAAARSEGKPNAAIELADLVDELASRSLPSMTAEEPA